MAGDLALIRKAIREGWAVSEATRGRIVLAIMHLFKHPATPERVAMSAVRTVLDMETANLLADPGDPDCVPDCPGCAATRRRLLRSKSRVWRQQPKIAVE